MGEAAERRSSPEEYLAWERKQPTKHEYVHRAIVAMAGASIPHNKIVANVLGELRAALRDKPCSALASDMRVRIPASGNYRYPDATVACDPLEYEDDEVDTLLNPTVIVEVLSSSTETEDWGSKFRDYRSIPSLREYLLVDQNEPLVEHYVRQESGLWTLRDVRENERIALTSCGVEIQVSDSTTRSSSNARPPDARRRSRVSLPPAPQIGQAYGPMLINKIDLGKKHEIFAESTPLGLIGLASAARPYADRLRARADARGPEDRGDVLPALRRRLPAPGRPDELRQQEPASAAPC